MNEVKIVNNNSNKAFIYSHGFGSRSKTFGAMVGAFPQYNHYLVDFREPKQGESLPTFKEYREYLKQVINSTKESEVILVGSSMGGGISVSLFDEPEVSKIILLAPMNPWNTTDLKAIERSFFPQTTNDLDFSWENLIYNPKPVLSSQLYIRSRERQLAIEKSNEWWKRPLMVDNHTPETHAVLTKAYQSVNKPTLLICGKEDKIISKESFEKIKDANSIIQPHLLDECGHAPLFEKKLQVLRLIEDFI